MCSRVTMSLVFIAKTLRPIDLLLEYNRGGREIGVYCLLIEHLNYPERSREKKFSAPRNQISRPTYLTLSRLYYDEPIHYISMVLK